MYVSFPQRALPRPIQLLVYLTLYRKPRQYATLKFIELCDFLFRAWAAMPSRHGRSLQFRCGRSHNRATVMTEGPQEQQGHPGQQGPWVPERLFRRPEAGFCASLGHLDPHAAQAFRAMPFKRRARPVQVNAQIGVAALEMHADIGAWFSLHCVVMSPS